MCVWCIKVLLESFAYLNLNKSTARFCTCMPIQLCVACKCLCSSTSWSLIKCTFTPTPHVKHSNTTCPVLSCWTLLASLVLLSLTASRKAPSWESWVSAGYSDLQRQICRQLLFLFVKAFWHGITLQRHVFHPNLLPLALRYPRSWPLSYLASTSYIFLSSFHLSFLLLSNPPQCSTTLDICSKNKPPQNRNPNKMMNST